MLQKGSQLVAADLRVTLVGFQRRAKEKNPFVGLKLKTEE